MHPLIIAALSKTGPGVVTLTAASAAGMDLGAGADSATAEWIFNADGTLDKNEDGGGATQVNSATNWIIPNRAAIRGLFIRFTQVSLVENETNPNLSTVLSGSTVDGTTWHTLGAGQARSLKLTTNSNTAGAGDATWIVTAEIANDSAGADIVATANFTMTGLVG